MQGNDLAPDDMHQPAPTPTPERGPEADAVPAPDAVDVPDPVQGEAAGLDLDAIEQDLADVEVALARLDAGTYWTDEVTGEPLPAELLAQRPTARRA